MAGFRTHVTTSSVLGSGYAGMLHTMYGVDVPTASVAGAMCGFAGMLPDLDSDSGVPLREAMGFSAAAIPMLLINRFESLHLSHEAMILIGIGLYFFVRFGLAHMIRKSTVHRGMFHSIPAMLICGGIAFLLTGASPINNRLMMSGGVVGGYLSHLILDEMYALEYKGGRWRTKKSFGTALKLWSGDGWSNFSTYAKLAIVGMGIVGEPGVMNRFGSNQPQLANQVNEAINLIGSLGKNQPQLAKQIDDLKNLVNAFSNNTAPTQQGPQGWPNGAPVATAPPNNQYPYAQPAATNAGQYAGPNYSSLPPQPLPPQTLPQTAPPNSQPSNWQWPVANQSYNSDGAAATYQDEYDTAQRPTPSYSQ